MTRENRQIFEGFLRRSGAKGAPLHRLHPSQDDPASRWKVQSIGDRGTVGCQCTVVLLSNLLDFAKLRRLAKLYGSILSHLHPPVIILIFSTGLYSDPHSGPGDESGNSRVVLGGDEWVVEILSEHYLELVAPKSLPGAQLALLDGPGCILTH